MVEVMYHILLYLKHVTLDLGFVELLLQIGDCDLELLTHHVHVDVFWLNILGWAFLSLPSSLLFLSSHIQLV